MSVTDSPKAAAVRSMFAEIAPRYDLLNHALSLNVDKLWRRRVVKMVEDKLRAPGAIALDLCCGTADLALELARLAETIGLDFCHPMLAIGSRKAAEANRPLMLMEGDALTVPMPDGSFDVVTIAFGLRNLDNIEGGLIEIFRLLKSGGRAAVLEFSHPVVPGFKSVFRFYFNRVLPMIGNAVSGSGFAYRYLPESVSSFPDQESLALLMRKSGFREVSYKNLSGGIAALHLGEKK